MQSQEKVTVYLKLTQMSISAVQKRRRPTRDVYKSFIQESDKATVLRPAFPANVVILHPLKNIGFLVFLEVENEIIDQNNPKVSLVYANYSLNAMIIDLF